MKWNLLLTALIGCGLVACQQSSPPEATSPDAAVGGRDTPATTPDPSEPQWDTSASPVAGAELSVSPDPADFCTDKLQVVEIRWDVVAANPSRLQIWVEDHQGKRKLWTAAKNYADVKATGKWARPGMKFIAVDPVQNRVLNSVTVQGGTCDGSSQPAASEQTSSS